MTSRVIAAAKSAYQYPLIIKHLWHAPLLQAADQEMFRHVGIEPRRQRVLALKSSVHFRADFQPIAKEVLVVVAPGPAKADPTMFHWTRLRPGLRLKPGGPATVPRSARRHARGSSARTRRWPPISTSHAARARRS